jgi:hypothetical protein
MCRFDPYFLSLASPLATAGGGFLTAKSESFVWGFILVTLAGLALLNVHPKPSR